MAFPIVHTSSTNYHTGNRSRSSYLANVLNSIQINLLIEERLSGFLSRNRVAKTLERRS